jgi:hypothetical protein
MSRWIKLHTSILHDARIGRLQWRDRGIWLMLLALAGEIEERDAEGRLTGRLDTLAGVAWHLHTRPDHIAPSIQRLLALELLFQDDAGVLYLADFAEQQAADTPAQRMQRYRQHSRNAPSPPPERDATVTPASRDRDAPVTPALRDVAESEQNRIRTDPEATLAAVAAVDNFVDMSVVVVDDSVDMAVAATDADAAESLKGADDAPAMLIRDGLQRAAPADAARGAAQPASGQAEALPRIRAPAFEGMSHPADLPEVADAAADDGFAGAEGPAAARASPHDGPAGAVRTHIRATAAAWDVNRAQARDRLVALGVDVAVAERLAREHPPERIQAWCAYARRQAGLSNPAGFVVNRLMQGLSPPGDAAPPPKRWYTDEEYARFFTV